MHLEDGVTRPGIEISIDEIIQLRDGGKNPTWEIEAGWLEARYGRRHDVPSADSDTMDNQPDGTATPKPVAPPPEPNSEHISTEETPELQVAVLKAVNSELEKRNTEKDQQIKRLETELDRRAEERREESELQKQNNVLMQQVYNLLIKMQSETGSTLQLRQPPPATGPTVEGDIIVDNQKSRQKRSNSNPSRDPKRSTSRSPAKQKRSTKKTGERKKAASSTWADKHLPTFTRYFPVRKQ